MILDRSITLAGRQAEVRARLAAAGIQNPSLDARLLIRLATGLTHEALIANPERPLSGLEAQRLEALTRRRLAREPMSRIAGTREFYGRPFLISRDTLDPRPETEILVECALEFAQTRKGEPLRVLDIGTGSGAILLSVLSELPQAHGIGTDLCRRALLTARQNAARLGLSERAGFVQTNWAGGVRGPFDIILSNPPYVAARAIPELDRDVRDYDPHLALDGGADGLDAYRAIAAEARPLLVSGGALAVEIGVGQAERVIRIFADQGFRYEQWYLDLSGRIRVVRFT